MTDATSRRTQEIAGAMTATTRFTDLPPGHPGRRLLTGHTPSFAAQSDPRFSYSLFVPEDLRDDEPPLRLWVFVHGTGRRTSLYLDAFVDLARAERAIVMTPLFPAGIEGPDDIHNYKTVDGAGVRFDHVLLSMVDEVALRWNVDASRFFLHGFSGGGQFAHRFAYLHPERLVAVSIGAPGQTTLPTGEASWRGVGDLEARFGRDFDVAAFAEVPVQVVVGSLDDDTADLAAMGPARDAVGRLVQARSLAVALEELGATVRLDVVDGAGHDGAAMLGAVAEFLTEQQAGGAS